MNLLNILSAAGAQNQGFQAQQQQQRELQAQQIAAQRLAALISQQSQGPGFQAAQPGANGGVMPQMGGPVPLPGASDGPQPGGDGMRAQLAQLFGGGNGAPPMGGPQITPFNAAPAEPTGDPFSMPRVASAVFGPGGGQTATDFLAFQDIEKTLRPYGQIQGRQALENTRQAGRVDLEEDKQKNRMELLQKKNEVIMRGQDKNYMARMASIGARATPAQKAELDTATKEFQQASMNYRNAKISMNSTSDDIDKLADVAIAAQKKMEDVTAKIAGGQSAPAAGGSPQGHQPTAEDIKHLKDNPAKAAKFDAYFGQGASAKILNAAGPKATVLDTTSGD